MSLPAVEKTILREFPDPALLAPMPDNPFFIARQYESLCNGLPDPTLVFTESGRYAAVLGGKHQRCSHDATALVGQFIADVLAPAKALWFLQQIREALSSQRVLVVEYELGAADLLGVPHGEPAETIWFEGRISALEGLFWGEQAVVWVAGNITANKRLQQQLQEQTLTDELTGLRNRRGFMRELAQAYAAHRQQGLSACLLSFDVDHFRAINEGLGHTAGDQALRDLAAAVSVLLAPEHVFGRLGANEFAVLCGGRSIAEITTLARGLLEVGRQALQLYATTDPVPSLSVGIAHFMPTDSSLEDIMRRADQALYAAKRQAGHRAVVADGTQSNYGLA